MATGFNTQTGGGEYRLQFETDNEEYFLLMQELARCCVDHQPVKTRGDRIRTMTDEQLATYWADHYDDFCPCNPECGEAINRDEPIPEERCAACALEWLRQSVEASHE